MILDYYQGLLVAYIPYTYREDNECEARNRNRANFEDHQREDDDQRHERVPEEVEQEQALEDALGVVAHQVDNLTGDTTKNRHAEQQYFHY